MSMRESGSIPWLPKTPFRQRAQLNPLLLLEEGISLLRLRKDSKKCILCGTPPLCVWPKCLTVALTVHLNTYILRAHIYTCVIMCVCV